MKATQTCRSTLIANIVEPRTRGPVERLRFLTLVVSSLSVLLAQCKQTQSASEVADAAAASPQMTLVPAPITSQTTAPTALIARNDGGTPRTATPLRSDLPAPSDTTGPEAAFELMASFRPIEVATPHNHEDGLRKKLEQRARVVLTPTRLSLSLEGAVVPEVGSQLRARVDLLGFLVLPKAESHYQVLAPNALRSWLDDGRFDAASPVASEAREGGNLGRKLGYKTRTIELITARGRATIELALVQDSGHGGALLCRVVGELIGTPSLSECGMDEVPVRAEVHWAHKSDSKVRGASLAPGGNSAPGSSQATNNSGASATAATATAATTAAASYSTSGFLIDVQKLERRTDLVDLASPPPMLVLHRPSAFRHHFFLGAGELADVRPGTRESGTLLIENQTAETRMIWLDGLPLLAMEPNSTTALDHLPKGKYPSSTSTFLGDEMMTHGSVEVPGRLTLKGQGASLLPGPTGGTASMKSSAPRP
jgi:hypothetical protein